jgi:hypothetical protein
MPLLGVVCVATCDRERHEQDEREHRCDTNPPDSCSFHRIFRLRLLRGIVKEGFARTASNGNARSSCERFFR